MTPTPWQMKLHTLLTRAARDLGYPEGYAPSGPRYRAWAKERGYPSDFRIVRRTPGQTWTRTVRYAGLKPAVELWTPASNRGKGEMPPLERARLRRLMVEDLRRVAREIGRPDRIPAPRTYRAHGRFHEMDLLRNLAGDPKGSWHDVAAAANLMPNRRRNGFWTRERARAEYLRVAKLLGRKPGGPGLTGGEIKRYIAHPRALAPYLAPTINEMAKVCGYQPWPSGYNRSHPMPKAAA